MNDRYNLIQGKFWSPKGDTEEQWKPVLQYEGIYECSSNGRIRRIVHYKNRSGILTPWNALGYSQVNLSKNNSIRRHSVHSIIAAAFIGQRPKDFEINHIDGIKNNNCISNLEYISRSENVRHAYRIGTNKNIGDNHHSRKLKSSDIPVIRKLRKSGISQWRVARMYGLKSSNSIAQIDSGKNWSHVL